MLEEQGRRDRADESNDFRGFTLHKLGWCSCLRRSATCRKVPVSIPNGVIGIFN